MNSLVDTWSKKPSEEDSMTEEHAWIWREMIKCIPNPDLSTARVLDVGCNQGGFCACFTIRDRLRRAWVSISQETGWHWPTLPRVTAHWRT